MCSWLEDEACCQLGKETMPSCHARGRAEGRARNEPRMGLRKKEHGQLAGAIGGEASQRVGLLARQVDAWHRALILGLAFFPWPAIWAKKKVIMD